MVGGLTMFYLIDVAIYIQLVTSVVYATIVTGNQSTPGHIISCIAGRYIGVGGGTTLLCVLLYRKFFE